MLGILGGVKRWTWFLWWNWCNPFNELCSGTIRVPYLVNLLFLKVIFMLISLVLLVQISNNCVSEVATEKKIYPFFCCTGPYYVETCLFIIQIIFFRILVSLKMDFVRNLWNIWNKYKFFLLTGTSGWGGGFYWFKNWQIAFEGNHDDTKKSRVLH